MKTKIKQTGAVLIGVLIGILTVATPLLLMAQTASDSSTGTTTSQNTSNDCRLALKPFIAKEEKSFREFVKQTLENKSDASALIKTLTERYRVYRKKLLAELDRLATIPNQDAALTLQQVLLCKEMADNSIATAEAVLRKAVVDNAQAKKTTKLVTKFKDINDKLGKLQREIGTLKGLQDSFQSKLPCFTAQCVR